MNGRVSSGCARRVGWWGALLLGLLCAFPVGAETRYVSDVLYISLREAPEDGARVLRIVKSGTPLEVLGSEDGYAHVRTRDGLEGWAKAKFLVDEPIARDRLEAAEERIAALEKENATLQRTVETLQARLAEAERERKRLDSVRARLEDELARLRELAAEPAALAEENERLKTRSAQMEQELTRLRAEVSQLRDRTRRDWFLAGAGVLGVGLLIGLILPRIRWRRRKEWLD